MFGRIWEQIVKTRDAVEGFSPAREFSQTLLRFSTGYEGTDNMFYFFYKIFIFIVNKEKDGLRSKYCKFSQSNHIAHAIFVFHSAMKTLVDQSKHMYYPNYFIKTLLHKPKISTFMICVLNYNTKHYIYKRTEAFYHSMTSKSEASDQTESVRPRIWQWHCELWTDISALLMLRLNCFVSNQIKLIAFI